jgi:hypothetical protein
MATENIQEMTTQELLQYLQSLHPDSTNKSTITASAKEYNEALNHLVTNVIPNANATDLNMIERFIAQERIKWADIKDSNPSLAFDEDFKSARGAGNAYDTPVNTVINTLAGAAKNVQKFKDLAPVDTPEDTRKLALDLWYDIYSLAPGTGGREMYDRLTQSYQREALAGMNLADLNYQAQALEQARTVKAITDQIKAERMARLKAGMSEAQIANQDMQMLMANINALNENARMLNQQRLQGQINYGLAQDQAYAAYLDQANARGQIGAGFYAAQAGDPVHQTNRIMQQFYPNGYTKSQWDDVYNIVINRDKQS